MVLLKLKIDRVEIEFAAVDQHELAWAERGDLAHQLASDRSPGACHQHPPAMDRLAPHFAVEHRLRAAQKLGHVDVAQIQFATDRKSVGSGKSGTARVTSGGRR